MTKAGRGATHDKPLEEMTEGELAAYYQAHKDDQDMWEADPAPPRVAGKAPIRSVFSVRFSRAELATIDAIAQQHGLTCSEAIRRAVIAYGSVARRWEYRDQLAAENDVVRVANDLSAEGWELISTAPHSAAEYHLFFKRAAVTTS
ncbi:MAG: hypothetical protein HW416_3832 [Chloroflexi bacterium]|nr:hypothetical protein [Chloroflexota bacterium]